MAKIPVRMPKMSMTMTEGEVSEWLASVGDEISEGDPICVVLTDKVDMEVEAPASGVLVSIEIEDGVVDVGVPIAWLEGDDSAGFGDLLASPEATTASDETDSGTEETGTTVTAEPEATEVTTESVPSVHPDSGHPPAAVPRARGLAHEHGLDLSQLSGSGPDGLITVYDVRALLPPDQETPEPGATTPRSKRAALVRARVAAAMIESATVPQVTLWRDLDLGEADRRRGGLSWTTVLARAYAQALRAVPALLRRWEDGAAVETGPPCIGLAVDTPLGLVAPVLLEPDREDAEQLDQRLRAMVRTVQTGRLEARYLQSANGMLSNLGGLGVDRFSALVTPPQASVLSTGSIRPRPVAVPGGVGSALTLTVGLTVDHRVADGADGGRVLDALSRALDDLPRPPD